MLSLNDRSDETEREDIFQKRLNEEEGCDDDDDDGDFDVSGETGQIEGRWEEDDEDEMGVTSGEREHDHCTPAMDGLFHNNQYFNNFHDQSNSHSRNQTRGGLSANTSTSSLVPFNNFSGENNKNGNISTLSGHQPSQYLQRKSKQERIIIIIIIIFVVFIVTLTVKKSFLSHKTYLRKLNIILLYWN